MFSTVSINNGRSKSQPVDRIDRRKPKQDEEPTPWQKWEMRSVQNAITIDTKTESSNEPVVDTPIQVNLVDEEELLRIHSQAKTAGEIEGRKIGFDQGQLDGYAAGLLVAQMEIEQLRTLLINLPAAMQMADQEITNDLLDLSLHIARQVVGQELKGDSKSIVSVVRDLLHMEPALSGSPRLMMNPEDMALVEKHLGEDIKAAGWRIRSDPTIMQGGCLVQAASGSLDSTLETRFERVSAAFGRTVQNQIESSQ